MAFLTGLEIATQGHIERRGRPCNMSDVLEAFATDDFRNFVAWTDRSGSFWSRPATAESAVGKRRSLQADRGATDGV